MAFFNLKKGEEGFKVSGYEISLNDFALWTRFVKINFFLFILFSQLKGYFLFLRMRSLFLADLNPLAPL